LLQAFGLAPVDPAAAVTAPALARALLGMVDLRTAIAAGAPVDAAAPVGRQTGER
jgi:hypothetical protein